MFFLKTSACDISLREELLFQSENVMWGSFPQSWSNIADTQLYKQFPAFKYHFHVILNNENKSKLMSAS